MRLTDAWQFWIAMITLGLASVGAVTGIVSLVRQTRTGDRSARASERAVDEAAEANQHGKRAADEAENATRAAERSADSADVSAAEARTITRIEAGRRHDELGPSVSVRWLWTPSAIGGDLSAMVTNNGRHDLVGRPAHLWESGGEQDLSDKTFHAGTTTKVPFDQYQTTVLGHENSRPQRWANRHTHLNMSDNQIRARLNAELETRGATVGFLRIRYRSAFVCPCSADPPSTEWGHWETRHYITELDI